MSAKQDMICHWTESLADNPEQQFSANGLLEEAIDEHAPSLQEARKLMRAVTPASRKHRQKGFIILTIVALFLVAWMSIKGWSWCDIVSEYSSLDIFSNFEAPDLPVKTKSAQEELLLHGDVNRTGPAAPWKGLWETQPENVVYFAEYVKKYATIGKALPPDTLSVAEKLDPENGWYLQLAAAFEALEAASTTSTEHPRSPVTKAQSKAARPEEKYRLFKQIVYQSQIHDPAKAKTVMDLWRKSLEKKHYETHDKAMQKIRVEILNRRASWSELDAPYVYLSEQSSSEPLTTFLRSVLIASLQNADFSTKDGQQLLQDVTSYSERIMRQDASSLLGHVVKVEALLCIYQQISVIDTSPLDPALVSLWKARYQALLEIVLRMREDTSDNDDFIEQHGILKYDLRYLTATNFTTRPPTLDISRLAPMRYADHCISLRGVCIAGCLLCFLMIPYHLLGERKAFVHRVSYEVWQAVPTRKIFLLVLMAVIAPLLYYALLTFFTDLTGKEWSVSYRYQFPWVPAVSVFLLVLLLTRLLADRCFYPWLDLRSPRRMGYRLWGWSAILFLLVLLHGMTFLTLLVKDDTAYLILLGVFWLPALLWLCVGAITRIGIGDFYDRVMAGVRCRVVGLCTASIIVILVLIHSSLPLLESYWIHQDTVCAVDSEMQAPIYTAEVTRNAQEDLRQAMKLTTDP